MDNKKLTDIVALFDEIGTNVTQTKKGAFILLVTDEDSQVNTWAGRDGTARSMMLSAMQQNEDFANIIIDVATTYLISDSALNELKKTIN